MDEIKKFSGERFYPEMQDDELEIEHLQRYYAAQRLVEGKYVLDAACGEGYGSNILSEKAKRVIGVDIDAESIVLANSKYGYKNNLEYIQGSIDNLNFIDTASQDIVISFETIEHVSRDIQKKFLKEIKRVLKPNGFLIMSTPNKKEYTDRYGFQNEFHIAEFYKEEYIEFLQQEFKFIHLYNQYLEVASFIDEENVNRDALDYIKNIEKYNPIGKYIIAIASNGELPKEKMSAVYMHHREEYLPTLDELNYCRKEAITCRNKVVYLDECINKNKLQSEELDRRLEELEKRQNLINELQRQNEEYKNKNKLQNEELDRRLEELEKRQNLINELQRQNEELEKRQYIINGLQNQICDLENKNNLQNIELEELRKWSIRYRLKALKNKYK